MRAGQIDLPDLAMPVVPRPSAPVSDEDPMRFSCRNPYKIERNKEGEITIMTPAGGIGGTHEKYITLEPDPIAKNVTIYRPNEAPETHERPEAVRGEGPVATFELACSPLWQ